MVALLLSQNSRDSLQTFRSFNSLLEFLPPVTIALILIFFVRILFVLSLALIVPFGGLDFLLPFLSPQLLGEFLFLIGQLLKSLRGYQRRSAPVAPWSALKSIADTLAWRLAEGCLWERR